MSKKIIAVFIVTICLGSISAQTFIGKINPFPQYKSSSTTANDTVKILGIMVNFQEDRDGATFGNGKFGTMYGSDYGNTIIDPLPHNKAYFEAHLEFVKNYFNKVSRGKTTVEYFVLPDTISVSQAMRNYSPDPNSDDFTPMANFSKEVWNIAQTNYPDVNFSSYDLFTIFHAGVGRDVSLPGSLGNERDLPSVYLGDETLRNILNNNMSGLPLNRNGKYNSMIIPETESREAESLTGTFLFQLSINGLLTASVASYMGLPDLFNTETGMSAIGRFGLMDGQAIFAYNGIFPPEPSAWEKIYLGWEEPVTVNPGSFNINLVAKNAAAIDDTVILKVPLNSSEYYLVENRMRDANSDGAKITYVLNGITRTKTFTKDTTGFLSYDVDSLRGVITDVDEYDWAIPNTISTNNDSYDSRPGGGIVIWHIDENIIQDKIAENKINVDKDNRGIDVEEADGVQDIGEIFYDIFGNQIVGEGFVEDYWYAGNPAQLYENKFSKDTRPNTNTNTGANSLITFSNFSAKSNRMSFNVSYGDSLIRPIFTFHLNSSLDVKGLTNSSTMLNLSFDIISDSALYKMDQTGERVIDSSFSSFKSASFEFNNNKYSVGAIGNELNIFSSIPAEIVTSQLPEGENVTTAPVIKKDQQGYIEILVGTSAGRVLTYSFQEAPFGIQLSDSAYLASSSVKKIALGDILLATTDSSFYLYPELIEMPKVMSRQNNYDNNLTSEIKDAALNLNTPVILYNENQFGIRHTDGTFSVFNISSNNAEVNSFSMTDLKNDGRNYILFTSGNNIEALNLQGASADNFPFEDPLEIGFTGTPLAADFEGNGKSEVIAFTKDGRIFAIDGGTGKVVTGFPISTGAELATTPVLFNYQGKASLAAVDVQNNFYAWNIGAIEGKMFWSEENGNNYNSSFVDAANNNGNLTNQFFPANRIYNYPNPVYDNTTYIRYYVSEDSKINIKIFDLAGGFVAELNDNALGGLDNETQWNVNDIQSGVYLARVEATGLSGKSESNIIKIAIIK